jgi:mono/diheme cytochrome c family protein
VTSGDPAHGKELFLSTCASCHALGDAGSTANVGPNLDDAFSSDKQQGFALSSIEDVVRGQIAYPDPGGPMKANLLNGQDANDVAVYIAQCSGNPSCGVTAEKPPSPTTTSSSGTTTTAAGPNGKQVFGSAGCASCHTLKDAGATGTVGPNLDQLKPSEAAVDKQVTNGGGIMPSFKGQLTPAQIKAVAKYVASVAGK